MSFTHICVRIINIKLNGSNSFANYSKNQNFNQFSIMIERIEIKLEMWFNMITIYNDN